MRTLVLLIALLCFSAVSFAQDATPTLEALPPVVEPVPATLGIDLPSLVIIGLLMVIIAGTLIVYQVTKANGIMLDPQSVKDILAPSYALLDKYFEKAIAEAAKTTTPVDDIVYTGARAVTNYSRRFVEVDETSPLEADWQPPIKPEV